MPHFAHRGAYAVACKEREKECEIRSDEIDIAGLAVVCIVMPMIGMLSFYFMGGTLALPLLIAMLVCGAIMALGAQEIVWKLKLHRRP